jgi:hypothetical protein
VRAAFGTGYDPALLVSPESFAQVVTWVLDAPVVVDVHEIALKPPVVR